MALLRSTGLVAWLCLLTAVRPAGATEYVMLGLHARVQLSDTIVLARVVDPANALLRVERVLKGEAPEQITLVSYVGGFMSPPDRKALIQGTRELIFLRRVRDAYAPVQDQYGRLTVTGNRLMDSFRAKPRGLSATLASIERLVTLQARAARSDSEADEACRTALASTDSEVRDWALYTAPQRIKHPSPALADAFLAHWPKDAASVASALTTWRLRRAAPLLAKTLSTSRDPRERAPAAMALGGTGDLTNLPLLRRVASTDPVAGVRAMAYNGVMQMLGPDSLGDLRLGGKDADQRVRIQVVVDSYNLLELENQERRWPPASSALIGEVRAFLAEMQDDPARMVSENAKSMLGMIARHRP